MVPAAVVIIGKSRGNWLAPISTALYPAMLAIDDILAVALRHGGTVTGEHGIGLLKRRALADELDEVARDLHTTVKQALDPHNIMNPGKIFTL